jgi:hypothetical protein
MAGACTADPLPLTAHHRAVSSLCWTLLSCDHSLLQPIYCTAASSQLDTSLQCVCCTAASMSFHTAHVSLTQHAQLREGHPKHGVHLQGSAVELSCPAWPPCQPVDAPQQVPSCSSIGHLHAASMQPACTPYASTHTMYHPKHQLDDGAEVLDAPQPVHA